MVLAICIGAALLGAGVLLRSWLRDRRTIREGGVPHRVVRGMRSTRAGNDAQVYADSSRLRNQFRNHRG